MVPCFYYYYYLVFHSDRMNGWMNLERKKVRVRHILILFLAIFYNIYFSNQSQYLHVLSKYAR